MEVTYKIYFFPATINLKKMKDVTYGEIVVDYCPEKYDSYHTRLTVSGNLIKYSGEVSTITTYLTKEKLLLNSTI